MKKAAIILVSVMSLGLLSACSSDVTSAPHKTEVKMTKQTVTYVSQHNLTETVSRLKQALATRNLNVFTEVDHAKGAQKAGLELSSSHLILFGNPKVGTVLMQKNIEMGIDLPMKALVFEQDGQIKVRMTDIKALAETHGLDASVPPVSKVAGVLNAIALEATQK